MSPHSLKKPGTLTRRELRTVALVMIVYAVGIAGMTIPATDELFVKLIPLVIIMSLAVSLAFHTTWDLKTVSVFSSIIILAWMVEAAGVATGTIFGIYSYGDSLGIKLLETPLLIGFNWLLLLYGTAGLTENLPTHSIVKILTASALMVIYDLVLEIAAPFLGMWQFESGTAPLRNYVAWFLLSVLFHSIIRFSGIKAFNRIASVIVVVQFIFFSVLALLFHFAK